MAVVLFVSRIIPRADLTGPIETIPNLGYYSPFDVGMPFEASHDKLSLSSSFLSSR